jgi:hypothetical protein
LLFLLDVAAIVLIAVWLWGVERSHKGWRLRIFDMRDQAAANASMRSAPRWRRLKPEAETPSEDAQSMAGSGRTRATPSSTPPRWRRTA